ncbi:MAG: hypothetical protein DLM72_00040 [Candidatus Nitrosopolaris wilkensis]|nr:MAG: hypothetical protein DLM72_00040 [Candidatus Nitrosopolaris wilkensis]
MLDIVFLLYTCSKQWQISRSTVFIEQLQLMPYHLVIVYAAISEGKAKMFIWKEVKKVRRGGNVLNVVLQFLRKYLFPANT